MADGQTQLVAGGKRHLDPSGKKYLVCCCACPNCDIAPTAYDIDFSGVTACPFHTIDGHTFHAPFTEHFPDDGGGFGEFCDWIGGVGSTSAGVIINATTAAVDMHVTVGLDSSPAFQSTPIAYGPDCSLAILIANDLTFADCSGSAAGYGGNAAATAVMPP